MRWPTVLLVCAAAAALSDTAGRLTVSASAATAGIRPVAAGRRLISLPRLDFALTIVPQCAPNTEPESISISVADTSKTLSATDFDDPSIIEVDISVPARQSGPLAAEGFCRIDEDGVADGVRPLLVEDAFTVQLSLRCVGDATKSIVYATAPLDVDLRCELADAREEAEASATQDVSSSPGVR